MNELELRRQLRNLRADREPNADLWMPIAQRIAMPRKRSRARRWLPLSLAATAALVALTLFYRSPLTSLEPAVVNVVEQKRGTPDGLLPGAAIELDREYRAALQSLPSSELPAELQRTASLLDDSADQLRAAISQQPESRHLIDQLRRVYELRLRLAQPAWLG